MSNFINLNNRINNKFLCTKLSIKLVKFIINLMLLLNFILSLCFSDFLNFLPNLLLLKSPCLSLVSVVELMNFQIKKWQYELRFI